MTYAIPQIDRRRAVEIARVAGRVALAVTKSAGNFLGGCAVIAGAGAFGGYSVLQLRKPDAVLLHQAIANAHDAAKRCAVGILLGLLGEAARRNEKSPLGVGGNKLASVPNIQDVPKLGVERIVAHFPASGADVSGWTFFKPGGRYGTDYIQRALITRYGLGCNIEEDAVYPSAKTDSAGQKLDGTNKYVIRFPKGQMPPVRGFWSLTMYDANWFFVANPLNRYTLSQRNALKSSPDGSVDLYIQAASPGPDKESNWLPAPSGPFELTLRLYWPKEHPPSLLDGTWKPPAVERVT